MSMRPGISQDIRRVRKSQRIGELPLPPGMPRRRHVAPAPAARPTHTARAAAGHWQKIWDIAQYPLLSIVALVAAANSRIGQLCVLVYAIGVLVVRRQPSSLSFGLALIVLVAIPVFQAIGQAGIAENAAVYVYELLVVGTIGAILELKNIS